jgi:hypothetical protein
MLAFLKDMKLIGRVMPLHCFRHNNGIDCGNVSPPLV